MGKMIFAFLQSIKGSRKTALQLRIKHNEEHEGVPEWPSWMDVIYIRNNVNHQTTLNRYVSTVAVLNGLNIGVRSNWCLVNHGHQVKVIRNAHVCKEYMIVT